MKKTEAALYARVLVLVFTAVLIAACGGNGGGGGNGLTFAEPAYFVSIDDPVASDSNPGTMGSPFAGIQAAIDAAAAAHSAAHVYVAQGDYPVSSVSGTNIVLSEGISVHGGYAADWSARDLNLYPAAIVNTSITDGSSSGQDNCTVFADMVSGATVIDGFNIVGGAGTVSLGIYISNSSVIISGNNISGGSATVFTIGIEVDSGSPSITDNTITGGLNHNFCTGIDIEYSAGPVISGNTVTAGSCEDSTGINQRSDSTVTISGNTVSGGAASNEAMGIYVETDTHPVIRDNLVEGGTGHRTYGIFNYMSGSALIASNVVYGGAGIEYSTGINNQQVAGPLTIRNNTVVGGVAQYSRGIYSYLTTQVVIEANVVSGGSGSYSRGILEDMLSANDIRNNLIYGGSGSSIIGVAVVDSSPEIRNNTINAGFGVSEYAIYFSAPSGVSQPVIENNILLGPGHGHGIFEYTSNAGPATVNNNDFFGFNYAFADFDLGCNSSPDCSIAQMEALADMTASGNVALDPVLEDVDGADDDLDTMDDNLWNLTASSPVLVTEGALNLSGDFTKDFEGTTRTAPWSMGAYEY